MACLIIVEGVDAGRKLALERHNLVMIGRDRECTYQIVDDRISRFHLQLRRDSESGRHHALDHRSSNGVYVNDTRIAEETPLSDGDRIRIGTTTLVYTTEDAPDAQRVMEAMKRGDQHWERTSVSERPPKK